MKLGFVSAILPDLSLAEVARYAAQTGYQCVEVMCWPTGKAERRYAGVTHIDVTDFTSAKADDVRRITRTMPLRKVAQPEDVAAQVVALASERLSGHVTGELVTVAGGMEGRVLHAD